MNKLPVHPDFTPRNFAKHVARSTIHLSVAKVVREAILDHSSFDDDNIPVKIAAYAVGWALSDTARPMTDAAVDKAADFITKKREERKTKKEAKKEETPKA